jgi:hypothetical protein
VDSLQQDGRSQKEENEAEERRIMICRMFEKLEKMTVRRKILIRKCAPYI